MQEIIQFLQTNVFLVVISVITIILFVWVILLQISLLRFKKMGSGVHLGEEGKRLEGVIEQQAQSIKALDKDIHELFDISNQINMLAHKGIHKVSMVRFNPFNDVGGDQSFSIALLNGRNNGIVLSSLYTREGTRIYSKSITSGKSEKHPLTEEELRVVKSAIDMETKKI
jgi:hypothetical protein